MHFESILKNVSKHISLDAKEEALFESLLIRKALGKKESLLTADQTCHSIYYVNTGVLRAFYRDKDANESIVMFAINDWWITDMYSFVNGKPAMLNIKALEPSDVFELPKADLDRLYLEVPKFERFFRIIFQNAYIREQLRIIQNLAMPAEERYENFMKKYPSFAQRIPLKQIAAYLGITPEFLSVLRKKAAGR